MEKTKGKKIFYNGHYLMGCRLDNWVRLLVQNRFSVGANIPQALYISGASLLLSPFVLAENLIYGKRIRKTEIKKDPLFIIGHWRTGTTYLQNLLSRDPQFGWADPLNTVTISNCLLLGRFLRSAESEALKSARPMDNMEYRLDLPVEETFGVATISPYSIIHMIAFPRNYLRYLPGAFVGDLPEREKRSWQRSYSYVLRKLTYIYHGKQLLLKSPDNTAHIKELMELYPDARFLNIYRDPYVTVMSTIHMFKKQMDLLRLSRLPDGDFEVMLEDTILSIFERMYQELFAMQKDFAPQHFVELRYEDFVKEPAKYLKMVYETLGMDGFDKALPYFQAYIDSQKGYVRNHFELSERLRQKINARLGFYFKHYGYEMQD